MFRQLPRILPILDDRRVQLCEPSSLLRDAVRVQGDQDFCPCLAPEDREQVFKWDVFRPERIDEEEGCRVSDLAQDLRNRLHERGSDLPFDDTNQEFLRRRLQTLETPPDLLRR